MLLAVDAGNSRTKLALFESDMIVARSSEATDHLAEPDDVAEEYRLVLAAVGSRASDIRVAIASVCPRLTPLLTTAVTAIPAGDPLVINNALRLGLTVAVREPTRLGSDRIADAVAAADRHGVPVIVADFGTALTFTVVTMDRRIVGGAIAPGLRTNARALATFTGQLPDVGGFEPNDVPPVIGTDTVGAIRAGTFYGMVGAARELIARIRSEVGESAPVVATGGTAPIVATHCGIDLLDPDLTLHGIRIIAELNPPSVI